MEKKERLSGISWLGFIHKPYEEWGERNWCLWVLVNSGPKVGCGRKLFPYIKIFRSRIYHVHH
jgi:hypothetical protein